MYVLKVIIFLGFTLFYCSVSFAQNDRPTTINPDSNRPIAESDTLSTPKDSVKRNTFSAIFRGKPGRAALYSAILPGAGQAYNKKWWKVPLAIGIDGFTIYNWANSKKEYNRYNDIYINLANGGTDPEYKSAADVKPIRDSKRAASELAILYFAIGHVITIFDAYVDRHLIEFDTSKDLSFRYFPAQGPNDIASVGFAIALN